MRARWLLLAATAPWSLACFGLLQPAVHFEDPLGLECGDWEIDVVAESPFGDTLEVDVGRDHRRHSWTVNGPGRFPVFGTATPGTDVHLVARLGSAGASHIITLPPAALTASLEGSLRDDRPGVLELAVDNPCGVPLVWRVQGPGVDAGGELSGFDRAQIPVAQHPAGPLVLQVSVEGEGAAPIAQTLTVVVAGPCVDGDGDGYGVCPDDAGVVDCDDSDAHVNPGAQEKPVPNQVDDNCDGRVDEGTTAYDDDGDGYAEDEGDCNDADATRFPGATEVWDCRDNNCNEQVDEGATRPERVDPFEPNNDRQSAVHLGGGNSVYVEAQILRGVGDDPEWFSLYSHDGPFDSWGVGVRALSIPDTGTWSVRIWEGEALQRSGEVAAEGEGVWLTGKSFRDDSGTYQVEIRPVGVDPECPATFAIIGR